MRLLRSLSPSSPGAPAATRGGQFGRAVPGGGNGIQPEKADQQLKGEERSGRAGGGVGWQEHEGRAFPGASHLARPRVPAGAHLLIARWGPQGRLSPREPRWTGGPAPAEPEPLSGEC